MTPALHAVHPVLMSRDVAASVAFYATLGFEAVFQDSPRDPKYAAVRRDGVELHLQWHDAAEWDHDGDRPTYRFLVDDVDGLSDQFARINGLDRTQVQDTPWGTREFHVRDPDGNGLHFYVDRAEGSAASPIDAEKLAAIERHFHALILQRASAFSGASAMELPSLAGAPRDENTAAWFRVPGMYGGFKYWLSGTADAPVLIAESWSRVVDGSGQRHEITPDGATMVDQGFV